MLYTHLQKKFRHTQHSLKNISVYKLNKVLVQKHDTLPFLQNFVIPKDEEKLSNNAAKCDSCLEENLADLGAQCALQYYFCISNCNYVCISENINFL